MISNSVDGNLEYSPTSNRRVWDRILTIRLFIVTIACLCCLLLTYLPFFHTPSDSAIVISNGSNYIKRRLQRMSRKPEDAVGSLDEYEDESEDAPERKKRPGQRGHGTGRAGGHKKRSRNATRGEHSHQQLISSHPLKPTKTVAASIPVAIDGEITPPWNDIPMPKKSYYAGFDAPNDPERWKRALFQASRGEQVLLKKVLEVIRSPFDYIHGSNSFKWVHQMSEHFKSKQTQFLTDLVHVKGQRAPIVLLGYREFDRKGHEGHMKGFYSMNPDEIFADKTFTIPRKIVGIGSMDENWGWLSTYFVNRTVPWALSLSKHPNPWSKDFPYCNEYMARVLDDPNLVALFINQHHNCTHPKVVSVPLGINDPKEVWSSVQRAMRTSLKKDQLIFTAGSDYAFRPFIRQCITKNMGDSMVVNSKISTEAFRMKIVSSMAVLCMPGLGYDTYRLWETLGSGSLPVVERGFGMDRTFYKLPVLMLDDYADLNANLLRQAYAEALYLAEEWEYERMTRRYWQSLIYETAETSSLEPLLSKHPMSAADETFTRPLVHYDCDSLGGCGPGTKRTPKKYCAVDPKLMVPGYNWVWDHSIGDAK
jgi:hypothetical protein